LDVTVKEQKLIGMNKIKRLESSVNSSRVYIAFAGGDGMLPISLNELEQNKVNINALTFIILPFGSGNDLA
jgi:diacylglycerol kinase family enzyme